ncbi:MAG: hypothetical protein M1824_004868 [Vezdaea acicularis]|nr:MAG: hypothetical protein M1824_004868 [Vezdaea acicularis]
MSSKELLSKARRLIPPMLEHFHKGQLGRVAVIGGSVDYTGAPYFSAMASARLGADMSHVICEPLAAQVIKTYSPNLMIHPLMRSHSSLSTPAQTDTPTNVSAPIISLLDRLHVLVIGPGLGRDSLMLDTCASILRAARKRDMPVVLDADALSIVASSPELFHGWKSVVLTPNVAEFARLWKSAVAAADGTEDAKETPVPEGTGRCKLLADKLGGVTVLQKGAQDVISNGTRTLLSDREGGRKRSGGQGDTLTGCLGTWLAWRRAYHEGLWEETEERMSEEESWLVAVWAGSALTRECSRRAYVKRGRSLQASDLTEEVHGAFLDVFGEREESAL